jgi:NAD(P)-dependent dehydrogenase (short-subunit alcohol dehydrogenase family)/acyl carrier protein
VRRLRRAPQLRQRARQWPPRGTVLVTGGTGALGAQVARWLAGNGAEHLVLASRRGPDAPGADELRAELTAAGAAVTIASCDVGDRDALAELLAAIPADRPLSAVVHTAAVLDDGLIEMLTADQLGRALHELTRDADLAAFVLFSSFGGIVGAPGQGNYAPGNAFLDALAEHRRGQGLVATSVAWGAWGGGGMADGPFGQTLHRHGLRDMAPELAVAALAQAVERDEGCLLIADIDWERFFVAFTATRPAPLLDDVPEVRRMVQAGFGPTQGAGDEPHAFVQRLVGLSEAEQDALVLETVREQVAAVLNLSGPEAVGVKRAFQEIGFDSVTAVELRNRLAAKTRLRMPVTLAFDHPTPGQLAAYVREQLMRDGDTVAAAALLDLDRVETALAAVAPGDAGRARILARMQALIDGVRGGPAGGPVAEDLSAASDEEMYELLGTKFGIS